MQTKKKPELSLDKVTPDNYIVPKGEELLYHVLQEIKRFDVQTGKRQSIPRIQKYGYRAWMNVRENLVKQGYTFEILHDPTELVEKQAGQKMQQMHKEPRKAVDVESIVKKELDEYKAGEADRIKQAVAAAMAAQKPETKERIIKLVDKTVISVVKNDEGNLIAYGEKDGEKTILTPGEYQSKTHTYTVGESGITTEKEIEKTTKK